MSAIRPNRNFDQEGPSKYNCKGQISSNTTRLHETIPNIPDTRLRSAYERFFGSNKNIK